MKTTPAVVDLARVDFLDLDFAVENFTGSALLEESLERCGILDPPSLLAGRDGGFTIVDGFKRLRWARRNGVGSVFCTVFDGDSDRAALMFRRIEGKLFGPPVNPAEKARIVSKLMEIIPLKEFASGFSKRLNVAPRQDVIRDWCRLADCDEGFLASVAEGEISDRVALELAGWDEAGRNAMTRVLGELRCSASIQMELVERVEEIALRLGGKGPEISGAPEVRTILEDPASNRRQKTEKVRELFRQWRFPRLSARERRFEEDLAKAGLPAEIRVVPPPSFEGERWQMRLTFSDPRELRRLLDEAADFAASSALAGFMRPEPSGTEDR